MDKNDNKDSNIDSFTRFKSFIDFMTEFGFVIYSLGYELNTDYFTLNIELQEVNLLGSKSLNSKTSSSFKTFEYDELKSWIEYSKQKMNEQNVPYIHNKNEQPQ